MILFLLIITSYFLFKVCFLAGREKLFTLPSKCLSYLAVIFNSEMERLVKAPWGRHSLSLISSDLSQLQICVVSFFRNKFVSHPYCCPNLLFVIKLMFWYFNTHCWFNNVRTFSSVWLLWSSLSEELRP